MSVPLCKHCNKEMILVVDKNTYVCATCGIEEVDLTDNELEQLSYIKTICRKMQLRKIPIEEKGFEKPKIINPIQGTPISHMRVLKEIKVEDYCNNSSKEFVLKNIDIYNFYQNKNTDINEVLPKERDENSCCICYEDLTPANQLYVECKHYLCKKCYNGLQFMLCHTLPNPCHKPEDNFVHKLCPICRTKIKEVKPANKFAILCLGQRTLMNEFMNGGYDGAFIFTYSDSDDQKFLCSEYPNITYNNNNKLLQKIKDLYKNNYVFVLQDYPKMKEWLKNVSINIFQDHGRATRVLDDDCIPFEKIIML